MNATPRSKKHQQLRVSKARATTDSLAFFNLLTSGEVLDELEQNLPEHRERVFPPTETLSLFLTQVMSSDQSCQQVVNGATIARLVMGLPACSTSTGAYCKARQRLPIDLVSSTVVRWANNCVRKHQINGVGMSVVFSSQTVPLCRCPDTAKIRHLFHSKVVNCLA